MAKRQYLYENVYYDLKQKIQSGDLKAGEKLESESDMIARYGVSAITLKKALNLLVEEGLIYRVKGKGSFVMKKLGENGLIEVEKEEEKQEVQEKYPTIGVVFEHVSSSYGLQIMYEMEMQARKAGYHLYPCFSYGNRDIETDAIRYLRRIGAKGIFVMPSHGAYYNTEILRLVIENYPTVLIDKRLEGISLDSVRTDNIQSISRLVEYLIGIGKKNIGYITIDETGTSSLAERKQGFYQKMEEFNLIPVEECCLPYIDYEESFEVYGGIYRKLIEAYFEKYEERLDAIICAEYGIAIEVMSVIKKRKLEEKIEVCCIDENYIGLGQYKMTHIKQDEKKIAQCAMEVMLDRIHGNGNSEKDYIIPGIFVEGKE